MIGPLDLRRTPAWLPVRPAGPGRGFALVRLDEAGYRAASFLDERLFAAPFVGADCAAAVLEEAAAALAPRSHYIFHIGHVGSTLVSRLVGEHEAFFSVREPLVLRTLADGDPPPPALSLATVQGLLARTWRGGQRSVVKPTSIVNELAGTILSAADGPQAVFMYTDPLSYLRGILGGPNSRRETDAMAPARRRRLERRAGRRLAIEPTTLGERAAMNWLAETATLHEAAERAAGRVRWVHFDRFLEEPHGGLAAIMRAFGADPSAAQIDAIVRGPLMLRYSKAPQYAYDAALRREVLAAADVEHRDEIRRGMQWLARIAADDALARRVLEARAQG